MIGQEPNQWRHAALKELVDNALDAAESVYPAIAPHVQMEFTETENGLILSVADNGSGIAPEHVPGIFDFTANSSTKLFYRAPTRGAQGNALKTLIGMPVALGQERGRLDIETRGWRHSLQAALTPVGIRKDHQQTAIETTGTRLTINIPGPLAGYHWEPARWIIAYGLFNPHAALQIRKIDPIGPAPEENDERNRAYADFSDLSLPATVAFPDPWRKFLPTDPTPAHWYSAAEWKTLVYAKADRNPNQTLGDFIQEFKNLSRVWRKVSKAVAVKTLGALMDDPQAITILHRALLDATSAPKPEILGRVGPDHFRQRFDDHFTMVQDAKGKDRYWYRHQWGMVDERPYLVEVAIAQTEQPGGVFYGLNYSVPFADPLAETWLLCTSQDEIIEGQGLAGFLRDAGVYCGRRYGKDQNITAAVHIVMPLLPTLDLGKTRLAIPPALATVMADLLGHAAKVLHKETVDARLRQRKREEHADQVTLAAFRAAQREQERERRQLEAEQDKEERQRQRQERQEKRAQEAKARRLRGELPIKQDVVFELMLPTYLDATDQERIRIAQRDQWYVLLPEYKKIKVRPSKKEDPESAMLDYKHFAKLVADYRRQCHPMLMLDYKARATLYEGHSGREIAFGDRELREYTLRHHEYAAILFIEKECVWPSLKDTGIDDLAKRYDLLIIISEGYATEAVRKLMAQAQQNGMQIFAWHDADPAGYNICRTLGEPTERMPDHHLDVIDIGLNIKEGLKMGLQTETFTRDYNLPNGIVPNLTDEERKMFTGNYDKEAGVWRNCERIEINAIKPRDRVTYLERKISEAMRCPVQSADPAQPQQRPTRPALAEMLAYGESILAREIKQQTHAALVERIDLDHIESTALATLPCYELDADRWQATLEADQQTPWREIMKQAATERLRIDPDLPDRINQAVVAAIRQALSYFVQRSGG